MERVSVAGLRARMKGLGAQFMPDRSSNEAHIYWSAPTGRWIKAVRKGPDVVELTFHATCPCSKA